MTPKQVKAIRALLGWTQIELARKADVPRVYVAYFESGKRYPEEVLERIHKVFRSTMVIAEVEDLHQVLSFNWAFHKESEAQKPRGSRGRSRTVRPQP